MRPHRPHVLTSLVAVTALSLLAAGCGGGGSSSRVASVAVSTATATTTTQNPAVAFSQCMRSNGVQSFPDPGNIGERNHKPTLQQLGVSGSQFEAARRACDHLLPNGDSGTQQTAQQLRTRLADELSFARCMRSHGLARFPDPTAQGQLSVEMVHAQGIDVHSPAVLHVVQACLPASHGALTPAKVRQALHDAGG